MTSAERLQQLRFLLAGAWNTLFGYLAFLAAHALVGNRLAGLAAVLLGYTIALPQAFLIQRWLVFRSRELWRSQFGRFAVTNTGILLANLVTMPVALRLTEADPRVIQAAFVVVSTVTSYLAHKHYTFRQGRTAA